MKYNKLMQALRVACVAVLLLTLAACGGNTYKSQRNIRVDLPGDHAADLAGAEKVVAALPLDELRGKIREAFPDVTEEALADFTIKTNVMQLGDESGAFVQTSLNFTDTGLPVNEIMDFVQMQIEEQIAELN